MFDYRKGFFKSLTFGGRGMGIRMGMGIRI